MCRKLIWKQVKSESTRAACLRFPFGLRLKIHSNFVIKLITFKRCCCLLVLCMRFDRMAQRENETWRFYGVWVGVLTGWNVANHWIKSMLDFFFACVFRHMNDEIDGANAAKRQYFYDGNSKTWRKRHVHTAEGGTYCRWKSSEMEI